MQLVYQKLNGRKICMQEEKLHVCLQERKKRNSFNKLVNGDKIISRM